MATVRAELHGLDALIRRYKKLVRSGRISVMPAASARLQRLREMRRHAHVAWCGLLGTPVERVEKGAKVPLDAHLVKQFARTLGYREWNKDWQMGRLL